MAEAPLELEAEDVLVAGDDALGDVLALAPDQRRAVALERQDGEGPAGQEMLDRRGRDAGARARPSRRCPTGGRATTPCRCRRARGAASGRRRRRRGAGRRSSPRAEATERHSTAPTVKSSTLSGAMIATPRPRPPSRSAPTMSPFGTMWAKGSPSLARPSKVRKTGRTASPVRLSVITISVIGCAFGGDRRPTRRAGPASGGRRRRSPRRGCRGRSPRAASHRPPSPRAPARRGEARARATGRHGRRRRSARRPGRSARRSLRRSRIVSRLYHRRHLLSTLIRLATSAMPAVSPRLAEPPSSHREGCGIWQPVPAGRRPSRPIAGQGRLTWERDRDAARRPRPREARGQPLPRAKPAGRLAARLRRPGDRPGAGRRRAHRRGARRPFAPRLFHAARRPLGADRLPGRPHPRRQELRHPPGGRHPARQGDLLHVVLLPGARGGSRPPDPDAEGAAAGGAAVGGRTQDAVPQRGARAGAALLGARAADRDPPGRPSATT